VWDQRVKQKKKKGGEATSFMDEFTKRVEKGEMGSVTNSRSNEL
jgi:hypothetical protein